MAGWPVAGTDYGTIRVRLSMGEWAPWAQVERTTARVYAGLVGLAGVLAAVVLRDDGPLALLALLIGAVAPAPRHRLARGRGPPPPQVLARPFPQAWEAVLQRDVAFFRALGSEEERLRFRRRIQLFLDEKQVTGIGIDLDPTTRVLAAASAVIPIFGFPGWEWHEIQEVLIYPDRFDRDFSVGDGEAHRILGMVGTGAMSRVMILSQPDLLRGFRNPGDRRNVGVHEFAHLVDLADGSLDGVPGGLDRDALGPWLDLVRRKMQEIADGRSDIDPYALTSEAEFFAVVSEYFFERPGVMQQRHPQLYAALERAFRQDLRSRLGAFRRALLPRPAIGRNSPCPCGSGRKYKKCCLARSREAA